MKKLLAISLVLLVASVTAATIASARVIDRNVPMIDDPLSRAVPRGGVFGVNTVQGTDTFYYGGTVIVGGEPYAAAPGAAGWLNRKMWTWSAAGYNGTPKSGLNMDGWKGVDNTAQTEDYFHVADDATMGQACVIDSSKSLFCGVTNAQAVDFCFVDQIGTGYGNNWSQTVATKSYHYSGAGQTISLAYNYHNESEPGYDFTRVFVQAWDAVHSVWVDVDTVAEYTDVLAGRDSILVDTYLGSFPTGVDLRFTFTFTADGGYSDEDGNFGTTCGGFLLDRYTVRTNGVVTDYTGFENVAVGGLPVGWSKIVLGCGDYARVKYITDLPLGLNQDPCVAQLGTQWCEIADSVLVFIDERYPDYLHPLCQDNYAKSPVIDFSGHPGLPGRMLHAERFGSLPMGDLVFLYWQARYKPGCASGGWSPWVSDNYVYYTAEGTSCRPLDFDISTFIPPEAQQVQVAWGVLNYCDEDPWGTGCSEDCNATPYFDNCCFGVFGSNVAPYISMRELDMWQTQFAEDGTLSPTSTADTRTANYLSNLVPPIFGDTLNCRVAGDNVEVRFVFKIEELGPRQPLTHPFFTTWFPGAAAGNWCEARMDTTRVTNSAGTGTLNSRGRYMATFHEEDPIRVANGLAEGTEMLPNNLFVPGTSIAYAVKARYIGHSDWFMLPDTVGANYPGTRGANPLIREELRDSGVPFTFWEWEVLPGYVDDGHGSVKWPCMILADHFGMRGNAGIDNASRIENILDLKGRWYWGSDWDIDVYIRYGPSSDLRNGIGRRTPNPGQLGGPGTPKWCASPGATQNQFMAYTHCMLNAGTIYSYSMYQTDVALISNWLNLYTSHDGISRFFWLSGDQVERELARRAWGAPFLTGTLCVAYGGDPDINYNYAGQNNDYTFCLPMHSVAGAHIVSLPNYVIRSNGCPRWYNVLQVSTSAGCTAAQAERQFDSQLTTRLAAISNIVDVTGGAKYKTFTEGYDNCTMRLYAYPPPNDYPFCLDELVAPDSMALEIWLDDVLEWGGLSHSSICDPILVNVNPNTGVAPAVVASLAQAYPNPMNPTATIRYTVGTPGKVMLRVFDVTGRVIRTLVDETQATGAYAVIWDGANDRGQKVASGVFFYQLEAPGYRGAKKIVILQ
jgi:hypothetical protein